MLWVPHVIILKQESVILLTRKAIVVLVIPELALVQEGDSLIPTRVVTKQRTYPIMATDTSKPWDTFWCSKRFKASGGGGGEQALFISELTTQAIDSLQCDYCSTTRSLCRLHV